MNYQVLMRVLHSGTDLTEQVQPLRDGKSMVIAILVDCQAFDKLHDQKIRALVMVKLVKRANVRVLQQRDCACFPLKLLATLRAWRRKEGEDLNGDRSVQSHVACTVDFSHSSRTNECADFVRSKPSRRAGRESLADRGLRKFQEFLRHLGFSRKKRIDFLSKWRVVSTLAVEKCGAFGDWNLHCAVEQLTDLLPAFRRHVFTHSASRGAAKLER